ncbi:putative small ribonucleoprotein associated, SmB/SmN [Helianthus debilis subsp. tardiflorus]
MSTSKGSKMLQFINYCMRVTIQDDRQLVGKFRAFNRHMNLVIGDCEELRKLPTAKGAKIDKEREDHRTIGLVLLRGEEVISMTIEGPPPPDENRAKAVGAAALAGPGLGRAAGQGIPTAPLVQAHPGLVGPVGGIGGPTPGMMQPQISHPPVTNMAAPLVNYPVIRPGQMSYPGQRPPQMPRRPLPQMSPQFAQRPPGRYPVPPPGQYGQRPMVPPSGQMMRGPIPPGGAPRLGMSGPPPPARPGCRLLVLRFWDLDLLARVCHLRRITSNNSSSSGW